MPVPQVRTERKGIRRTKAGRVMVRLAQRLPMPGFGGRSVYDVASPFAAQLRKTSLAERAAAISFNIVMAIPPTLVFIFTLIPYLPISKDFINQLFVLIRDVIPGEQNHKAIIGFLKDFVQRPRNGLLSFGLLLAVFFSSNAMMGVLRSFEKDYPGFRRRKGIHKRRIALKLTFITLLLIFICILLLIAQSAVLKLFGVRSQSLRMFIQVLRWIPLVLLTYAIITMIYRHGPAVKEKWSLRTPGAIFATVLMVIATGLVTYWVNHFSNYNKLYGSISAIFILMSLIYANSLALLLGFELNVALEQRPAGKGPKRG